MESVHWSGHLHAHDCLLFASAGRALYCCLCAAAAVDKLANPKEFFTACYHTLLCCPESSESSNSSSNSSTCSGKITQQLCVKAMAAAYSAHAGTIGPFEGIPHLLQLLDNTQQRSLRHALLLFLQALIAPKAAGDVAVPPPSSSTATTLPNVSGSVAAAAAVSQQQGQSNNQVSSSSSKPTTSQQKTSAAQAAAVRAAKANGYLLMDHGGLQLLVDFVAGAHECTERRIAAAAAAGAGGAAGAGHLITSISHAEVSVAVRCPTCR
jgi:DnaJ family protein C protein 13